MQLHSLLLSLAASLALAMPALAAPIKTEAASGVLTDDKGMTLYIFDKDAAGVSNCNGDCAAKWPPLAAGTDAAAEGDFSVVTRADGSKQWAFKAMPLYSWIKDQKPGDMTGDGVKGVWHVVKP